MTKCYSKKTIEKETSFELGNIKTNQKVNIDAHGSALIFELFDIEKNKTIEIIKPKMPSFNFNVPYNSKWKLIVSFNSSLILKTDIEIEIN